jgi:hypothetical protein
MLDQINRLALFLINRWLQFLPKSITIGKIIMDMVKPMVTVMFLKLVNSIGSPTKQQTPTITYHSLALYAILLPQAIKITAKTKASP